MNCAFCDDPEVKERVIIENESAFAVPTKTPIVPGHLLVCPKRHIQYYEEATSEEKDAMELLRVTLKWGLQKAFGAQGFNYAWNEEVIGGQSVPHVHLHILPRKEGDAGIYRYEPREFLYRPGPRSVSTPSEELGEIVLLVQRALAER